jgi:P4 family phage/plasmid primase-like protien
LLTAAAEHSGRFALPPKLPVAAKRSVIRSLLKASLLEEVPAPDDEPQFTWRPDDTGDSLALRITAAGLSAIGVENPTDHTGTTGAGMPEGDAGPVGPEPGPAGRRSLQSAAQAVIDVWDRSPAAGDRQLIAAVDQLRIGLSARPAPRSKGPRVVRSGTKQATVIVLLRRQEGASGPQIAEATGWAPHTVRGFLAGLQKKGVPVMVLERVRQVGPNQAGTKGSYAGYMLTGDTREHAFLVLCGPGGNGKGVLVNTLASALGDYATTAPMETFMASSQPQHPTDLAGLRGARLVLAQETEAGRVLAEGRIKALTGGDRIAARFMRGDFFEFVPAFKLVLVGNHRPVIRNPDDAMRRRMHLLPLTFKPPKPDPELSARLHEELPGILQWAIQGCLAWQREGLSRPTVVRDATADYFYEQDLLVQWLAERCQVQRGAYAPSSALYRDWKAWAEPRAILRSWTGSACQPYFWYI